MVENIKCSLCGEEIEGKDEVCLLCSGTGKMVAGGYIFKRPIVSCSWCKGTGVQTKYAIEEHYDDKHRDFTTVLRNHVMKFCGNAGYL